MKQKPPRWVQITAAVLRRYLALDMTVYAGSATLFLLTASFPLLMWVLMLVNLVPGFSVEGVAELLADFLPQIPEIQTAILGLLQNLSGQSAQFVASLAVLTTIVSASGGMNALQIGLQRLTPGSHRTFLNRLLAIGYTFVFELLLFVMLALQGMHSLFARFADTLPFFRHYAAIVAPLQRVADIVSRCGSNVVSVLHDGSDPNMPISSCFLKLALETRDHAQIEQIRQELTKEGFQLVAERV